MGHHQTYFPEVRHCPLAGQCVPLAPSPSNPPILSGWCRLTLPFHLCHASHAFVFIFDFIFVLDWVRVLVCHCVCFRACVPAFVSALVLACVSVRVFVYLCM